MSKAKIKIENYSYIMFFINIQTKNSIMSNLISSHRQFRRRKATLSIADSSQHSAISPRSLNILNSIDILPTISEIDEDNMSVPFIDFRTRNQIKIQNIKRFVLSNPVQEKLTNSVVWGAKYRLRF